MQVWEVQPPHTLRHELGGLPVWNGWRLVERPCSVIWVHLFGLLRQTRCAGFAAKYRTQEAAPCVTESLTRCCLASIKALNQHIYMFFCHKGLAPAMVFMGIATQHCKLE